MNIFNLKDDCIQKIETVFKDYDLSHKKINKMLRFQDDYEETLDMINDAIKESKSNSPLFSNDNRFVQNVIMANIFKERNEEFNEMDHFEYSTKYKTNELMHSREFEYILNGHYLLSLFKSDFINIDWKKYGFISAEELYYCMGAHLANILHYNDTREITVQHTGEYKHLVSHYDHYIHGDFRISQYDMSFFTMINPYDDSEKLPFGKPKKIGNLAGYHSVEHVFLIGLMAFALKQNIKLPVLDNYKEFLNNLTEREQSFGNFADAGDYSKYMSLSAMSGIESNYIPSIPLEFEGTYEASISDNKLAYHRSDDGRTRFKIYPEMVDELIRGLFKKVNVGNGRSSVAELNDCVIHFKEKYYDKQ